MTDKIAEIRARHEVDAKIATVLNPELPPTWTLAGWRAHDDRAALLAEVERLRAALIEWDALIKHQFSGTRDAMSDMQRAALNTKRILDELEAKP